MAGTTMIRWYSKRKKIFTESFKGQETVEIDELPELIRYKVEELYDTLHNSNKNK